MQLQGKKVVVIGGSSGTGLKTAQVAVQEGATVVIASRQKEKLQAVSKKIGSHVITKCLDIRNRQQVQDFFDQIGIFDHLITPGSASTPGSCLELSIERARDSFESKFWGQYYAVRYGVPQIKQGGSIVLCSGVFSQRPIENAAIMAAVNSAVEGLGRALALEIAPIRVNTVCPGYVETPRFSHLEEKERASLFNQVAKQLPVKRIGQPEEIAHAILYLMTNDYSTGTTLYIDGGHCIK